jgi:hypothetical protein
MNRVHIHFVVEDLNARMRATGERSAEESNEQH